MLTFGDKPDDDAQVVLRRFHELAIQTGCPLTTTHLLRALLELQSDMVERVLGVAIKPDEVLDFSHEIMPGSTRSAVLTPNADLAAAAAERCLEQCGTKEITPVHLLFGVLAVRNAAGALVLEKECGVDIGLAQCMAVAIISEGYEGNAAELKELLRESAKQYSWVRETVAELTGRVVRIDT